MTSIARVLLSRLNLQIKALNSLQLRSDSMAHKQFKGLQDLYVDHRL